jgi:hypothetical protein
MRLSLISPEWVIAILTLAYVLLTAVYVYVTFRAFRVIREQSTHMAESIEVSRQQVALAREQSEIAKQAADASKEAAEAARDSANTLLNSERAWVLVEIGQIPNFQQEPDKLEFLWIHPTIRNYGRTPGRIKNIVARIALMPDGQGLPPKPEYPTGQGANLMVDVVLPPSVPIQPIKLGMTGQEFIQVQQRKLFLYVHGFLDYLDISDIRRHSGFCYFYQVQAGYNPSPTGFYLDLTAPPSYTECT